MNKDEAMRIALEALENNRCIIESEIHPPEALEEFDVAITALRQAIEQAEKQEPVAWIDGKRFKSLCDNRSVVTKITSYQVYPDDVALYPAPQRKEWVGLTDEEINEAQETAYRSLRQHQMRIRGQIITPADSPDWHFARAIEAKLKEKNHD